MITFLIMALMDLLKSEYTQSLGKTTGARRKGGAVLKAKIDGRAPSTQAQTDSLVAFGRLNRFSGGVAKGWVKPLGLDVSSMLPHNAFSKMARPLIRDHVFNPLLWTVVIPANPGLTYSFAGWNGSQRVTTINFNPDAEWRQRFDVTVHVAIIDRFGTVYGKADVALGNQKADVIIPESTMHPLYAMCWADYIYNNKRRHEAGGVVEITGLQYSLTPQLTGDSWIDGSPVYQCTYDLIIDPDQREYNITPKQTMRLVLSAEVIIQDITNHLTVASLPSIQSANAPLIFNYQQGDPQMRLTLTGAGSVNTVYLTLKYI